MRTAVFSDVHGNLVALEAMLADLERRPVDQLICLGDALQGGPQPREVAQRLAELACQVVLGNADWFVLTGEAQREPVTEEQLAVAAWSHERLGPNDLELIRSYEATIELDLGGARRMLAFHGSPASYDDVILPGTPEDEMRALLGSAAAEVLAGGHVHTQWVRRLDGRLLLNPGSVGLGYDHDADPVVPFPWAEYAVITSEDERLEIELLKTTFDVDAVVAAYDATDHPFAAQDAARWSASPRRRP